MANCVKFRFSINLQLFSVDLKMCPCKTYSHILSLIFASNTQFMSIYELMVTELSQCLIIMDSKYSKVGINIFACRLCSKWCQTFGGRCIYIYAYIYMPSSEPSYITVILIYIIYSHNMIYEWNERWTGVSTSLQPQGKDPVCYLFTGGKDLCQPHFRL